MLEEKIKMSRFFKKYDDNNLHTIYEIFGIKIKKINVKLALSNIQNQMYWASTEFPITMWETHGVFDKLLSYFEFVSYSTYAWRTYSPHFWLTYVCCLLEVKQYDDAQNIINKFLKYYGLSEVEKFLPVCQFLHQIGITNNRIEKAAFVYQYLKSNNKKNIFKQLLQNRKVAIVGNSPSEIGKNKGQEIDAHDIVIRFNNYTLKGFESDYGTKTDIWARGSGGDDVKVRKEKFKLVTWEADYDHWRVVDNHLDIMYKQINNNQLLYNFDFENHISLRKASGIDFPTTGLVFIWEVYRKLETLENIDFYGFNFLQEKKDRFATHYFLDRDDIESEKRTRNHNLIQEAEFLCNLIKGEKYKCY